MSALKGKNVRSCCSIVLYALSHEGLDQMVFQGPFHPGVFYILWFHDSVPFSFILFGYRSSSCAQGMNPFMLQNSLNALGILSWVWWKWERCRQLLMYWEGQELSFIRAHLSLQPTHLRSEHCCLNTHTLHSQHSSSAMRQPVVGKCIFK